MRPITRKPLNAMLFVVTFFWISFITIAGASAQVATNVQLSSSELVFSAVNGTVSSPKVLSLTNKGSVAISVSSLSFAGGLQTPFSLLAPLSFPVVIDAGKSLSLSFVFKPKADATAAKSLEDYVTLVTTDSSASIQVNLYGLSTKGENGSLEPPLNNVVTTLGFMIDVGGKSELIGTTPTPIGDEVVMPLFRKAKETEPVEMRPVARYSPATLAPFGFYLPNVGSPQTTTLATIQATQSQTLNPALVAGGSQQFNPGSGPFGLWVNFDDGKGKKYTVYSEDAKNISGSTPHAVRVYPLKNRSGQSVANSYLVAYEVAANGDYQDFVFLLSNVVPASPTVLKTRPKNGEVNVPVDAFISADVIIPNGGVDVKTLEGNVLLRSSNGSLLPAVLNSTGGGDAIILRPAALLSSNAQYTFEVTNGVKDTSGASFAPFKMSFTTGKAPDVGNQTVVFEKVDLLVPPVLPYTAVTIGPDNRLYAGTIYGDIYRFDINPDGTLRVPTAPGTASKIMSIRDHFGGMRYLIGLQFDPDSTASNLILWTSTSAFAFQNAPDWTGTITRLSGPNLTVVDDYVVGLPRSSKDHVTNQIAFGPDGALYFAQGSSSAMGAFDTAWQRDEHLLTAAVLRLDPKAVINPPLNVKTEDGGAYDPFAPGAPLTIYASGVRNAYDLLWHSNGKLYAPTNGSAGGGNTPSTPLPFKPPYLPRIDQGLNGAFTGPQVPAISVAGARSDYLFDIVKGGYYGHPNPTRNEYVLNGGNPTATTDSAEVNDYPVGTLPDRNWRGIAFDFGLNQSPDGIIEYKSTTFGGALAGKLMVARFSGGDDIVVLTPDQSGKIVKSQAGISGLTNFNDPLDLTENTANGNVYVAEFGPQDISQSGGKKITLLRPFVAPSELKTTAFTNSSVSLSWVDNTSSETRFSIERKLSSGGLFAEVGSVAAGKLTYVDEGLAPSTAYVYRVRAVGSVNSGYSNEVSVTTSGAPVGTGLKGQYFDNLDFTNLKITRVDGTVNLSLRAGLSPVTGISPDTFSVRWTGFVVPKFSQTYTFYTTSDDGVRLTVDGKTIINNYTNHAAIENSATVTLQANRKYTIALDYYNNTGAAVAKLSWSSQSQPKEVIPQAQLYPQ